MWRIYKTNQEDKELQELNKIETGCWIDIVNPTEEELTNISNDLNIPVEFLKSGLDDEEQPRVELGENHKMFIVDVPYVHERNQITSIKTIPLCIILLRDEYFVTLSLKKCEVLNDFKESKVKEFYTHKKSRFMIQLLYKVASSYIKYLNIVNLHMEQAEDRMVSSTKNKELVQLMGLEKSLVYMTTSLKSNGIVLEKILKGNTIDLYEEDEELLEDAIIENNQGIETSNLYREILGSMTDTFATIISNNLNVIMKFLAGITIVLSIPTMVASFMGMNVPLGKLATNPMSFVLLLMISVLLSLIVAYILKKKNML